MKGSLFVEFIRYKFLSLLYSIYKFEIFASLALIPKSVLATALSGSVWIKGPVTTALLSLGRNFEYKKNTKN